MSAIKDIIDLTTNLANNANDRKLASEMLQIQRLILSVQAIDAALVDENLGCKNKISDLVKENSNLKKENSDLVTKKLELVKENAKIVAINLELEKENALLKKPKLAQAQAPKWDQYEEM